MADKDPAPTGAGKGSTPTSKKPMTHEEVATMVYRRAAASRETLADQLSRTREAIICQSEIIQHLIDLLKKQAHVTADASRTTAVALYDASDEYTAITKDTLATVALPLALGLGILIQQQFTLLAMPDPTRGWKDRVWDRFGQEIRLCMFREIAGEGDCVIDVATFTPPEAPLPADLSTFPFIIEPGPADIEK